MRAEYDLGVSKGQPEHGSTRIPPYVPPYRAISDKDFSSNRLSELALHADEFVHYTRLIHNSGGRIRTSDLRVMGPIRPKIVSRGQASI